MATTETSTPSSLTDLLLDTTSSSSSWLTDLGSELSLSSDTVSEKAESFYQNTVGFLQSKAVLDDTAARKLPRQFMAGTPSFQAEDETLRLQMPLTGAGTGNQNDKNGDDATTPEMDLDALYEIASLTLPKFKRIVTQIVVQAGLDPEQAIVFDKELMMEQQQAQSTRTLSLTTTAEGTPTTTSQQPADAQQQLQHLVLAPLKGRGRALEKIRADYGGRNAKLLDVVRCSIIVHTEDELVRVAQALDSQETDKEFTVVRCKNRFKEPLFNGYRDALYTIRIPVTPPGSSDNDDNNDTNDDTQPTTTATPVVHHCCEVQVHLSDLIFHKSTSHIYYEYFRAYFSGNVQAADQRMRVLERVVGDQPQATLAATMEVCIRGNSDDADETRTMTQQEQEQRLEALLELLGEDNMTEYALAARVAHRLVELSLQETNDDDPESSNEQAIARLVQLGRLLRLAYKYDQAEMVLDKTRQAATSRLGAEHRLTLKACENHAILMAETRRYDESKALHRSTLEIRERVLGEEDPDTLSSCQVLAIVLDKPGHYEEARPYFARAYEGRSKVLGPDHRETLDSANGLAVLDMMNGQYDSAESIFRATIKTQKEKYGLDHAKTKWTGNNLAGLLMICGRDNEAQELANEIGLS